MGGPLRDTAPKRPAEHVVAHAPLLLAAAVVAGALAGRPLVGAAAAGAVAGTMLSRWSPAGGRVVLLVSAALLVSGVLAARAVPRPVPPGPYEGVVVLRDDPAPRGPGVAAAAALDSGSLVEVVAYGTAGRRLAERLAGEHVAVRGRLDRTDARGAARHLAGRLTVTAATDWAEGDALARSANRLRRLVDRGARTLGPADAALYQGMVLGDDRALPPAVRADFLGAGLSHLTAVSGQNVAFLLALASPLLRGRRPGARWALTVALIAWFALATRFEPSVLRASAMAGLAATASALGRPAGTLRLLSLAVAGLVLVDPLLVRSVGFWLSTGATAGIALLAVPLADRLPGPRPLATAGGVTLAAQVGVAPVSVAVFGTLPLASLPANLLAVPAAGPVMVYGLPAGFVAAVVPDPVAALVQVPTALCVAWVRGVAHVAAAAPLPAGGPVPVLALGAAVLAVLARTPRAPRTAAR